MPPTAELLERARQCQARGDLPQAERLSRQLLEVDPRHAEGWLLLAGVLQGQGRHHEALAPLQQALRLQPNSAEAHFRLGQALDGQGQRGQAVAHYRQAVRLRPDHPEALNGLGVLLAQQGQLEEAIAHLTQAVRVRPDFAAAFHNLGVALAQQGKPQEAVASLEQALKVKPDYPEACYNLAAILAEMGKGDEAIAHYRRAIELRPNYGEAYNNLGLALNEARRHAEALVILQQAVRLRPQAPEGHNNLGLAYSDLGRFAEAGMCFREALRLNPGYVEGHTNLGSLYKDWGRLDEALASYQVALWHDPRSASTRYNRSLALLQKGEWEEGWPEYEWRWHRKQTPPRPFRQPRWDGSPLGGRSVLLWCEQGLGDMIMFVRYAPLVKAKGGRVVLECPGCLVPLFNTSARVERVVAEGEELPGVDVQAPLMSLPGLLGTTLATVPAEVPYLHPDPARVEEWRRRLGEVPGFKVGIAWQGNPRHDWDRWRSAPLECFAPLAEVEGVRLVSLQRGHGAEQVQALRGRFSVREVGDSPGPEAGDFLETAALMKSLDLVVTVDTAAAHLAGALGVPAWVALARVADWRWLVGREDTPWYPGMRLVRQDRLGEWAPVFERMAGDLHRLVAARTRQRGGVLIEVSPGELIDRITILEIKAGRVGDLQKRAALQAELRALQYTRDRTVAPCEQLERLAAELRRVNESLWEVEDELRVCEREQEFGGRFVQLARAVYQANDRRSALKRRINELLRSPLREYKIYQSDAPAAVNP